VPIYDPERGVPIMGLSDGDRLHLRSVSEDCEAYVGEGEPRFEEFGSVSLIEDANTVDGIRVAPTDDVDSRYHSMEVSTIEELTRFKTTKEGYSTTVPVALGRTL
jgi:hypothetical protein